MLPLLGARSEEVMLSAEGARNIKSSQSDDDDLKNHKNNMSSYIMRYISRTIEHTDDDDTKIHKSNTY